MTPRTWLLLSWIVAGTVLLVVHTVLVWQVLRSAESLGGRRWWALLPPATPFLAFKAGRRWSVGAWVLSVATYVVLRALEG